MAAERKLKESEATSGFFVLLGERGKKATLEWCMKMNLMPSRYECPICSKDMRLQERKGTIDSYEWRCRSQSKENPHDVNRSVRKGTWFSESKLGLCIILRLTRYWFGKSTNEFVVNDLKVNKNTVVDWYALCREVCMLACVNESAKLGGEGETVEIEESLLGKMKHVTERRVNGRWVFGGVQRKSKKCFFRVVQSRTKEELLEVIREWILPGTTIISDCWKTYDCLSDEGYVHLRVDHNLTFVDSEAGAHTWSAIKKTLPAAHVEGQFDSYLAEYMWRRANGHKMVDANFNDYLRAIAQVYPPREKDDPLEWDMSIRSVKRICVWLNERVRLMVLSEVPKESAYDRIDNMTKEEFLKVGNVVELSLQNMTAFTNVSLKGPFIRAKSYNGRGRMGCYSWFTVFDTLNEPFAVQRSSVIHMPVATLIFNLHRDDQFIPGQKTGMYFSLHSPHISADNPADNGIFMKLGKVYRIYVSMEKEVLLPHPYETACVNYTDIWRNRNKTGPRTQEILLKMDKWLKRRKFNDDNSDNDNVRDQVNEPTPGTSKNISC
ncbi:mitotic-spindle organizing protein 2A [Trichonephila clavipes]|nr:mitotic-spindle organizing protein 2A [Trichonephila clavipes]